VGGAADGSKLPAGLEVGTAAALLVVAAALSVGPEAVADGERAAPLAERRAPPAVPVVLLFAGFEVRVGLGDAVGGAGFGFGWALSCGQIVDAATSGGSVLPPSCQTQASVDPGLGLWVPAPSLA
jgi:hypothetical protein